MVAREVSVLILLQVSSRRLSANSLVCDSQLLLSKFLNINP
jgi:hypothetical protein